MAHHRGVVRQHWSRVAADVRDVASGIRDSHGIIATSWDTAYTVTASPARGKRFYLVQDYEPLFSPAGSESMLAEATYELGLHGITAGAWLARKLRVDHGMECDFFPFGCDVETYRLVEDSLAAWARDGVAYYCRPRTARRGHELAILALTRLAEQCPGTPIHFFGDRIRRLPFEAQQHGLLSPAELNELYNRCAAGLVISATNVSLVPWEMLSAGCVPVVNDATHNRMVLGDADVEYAAASPGAMAGALAALLQVSLSKRMRRAALAARSVNDASWPAAGQKVEEVLCREVERAVKA